MEIKTSFLQEASLSHMPQESTYLFSGSYTEFNKFYAPAVLQEYMMLETIKRGIPRYNFPWYSRESLTGQTVFFVSNKTSTATSHVRWGPSVITQNPLEIQTDFSH